MHSLLPNIRCDKYNNYTCAFVKFVIKTKTSATRLTLTLDASSAICEIQNNSALYYDRNQIEMEEISLFFSRLLTDFSLTCSSQRRPSRQLLKLIESLRAMCSFCGRHRSENHTEIIHLHASADNGASFSRQRRTAEDNSAHSPSEEAFKRNRWTWPGRTSFASNEHEGGNARENPQDGHKTRKKKTPQAMKIIGHNWMVLCLSK